MQSPAEGPKQYRAAAFNAPDLDGSLKRGTLALRNEQDREFEPYNRAREINYWGCMVFCLYICAFGFYLWIRIAKTLDLAGYLWCGPVAWLCCHAHWCAMLVHCKLGAPGIHHSCISWQLLSTGEALTPCRAQVWHHRADCGGHGLHHRHPVRHQPALQPSDDGV